MQKININPNRKTNAMASIITKRLSGILLMLILMGNAAELLSQQLPSFSQYMMNEFVINPSTAGKDGSTTFNGTARKTWLSLGNEMRSPQNICLSAQTRMLKNPFSIKRGRHGNTYNKASKGRVGLGGALYTDNSGALTKTSIQLSYAYHLRLHNAQLSFGVTPTMTQMKYNADYLDFYNNDIEPMLAVATSPTWIPDVNAGVNYRTHVYQIGLSVAQIFQSPAMFGNSEIDYKSSGIGFKRSYNIIGAAYLDLPSNPDWMVEPSFLLKMNNLFDFKGDAYKPGSQLDVSIKMFYDSRYWVGASYRTISDFVLMGGIVVKNYYISYSFDYGFSPLYASSLGSHEISISAKFGSEARRYRWVERY